VIFRRYIAYTVYIYVLLESLIQINMWFPVLVNSVVSVVAYLVAVRIIPRFKDMFVKANLCGIDMSKKRKEKM
jgi:UDP-N-acetylglucosamine--dolichyl-phosphate N-acetylglucosaminephosphotransferase